MELQLNVRHGNVSSAVRASVERKLTRLGRRLPEEAVVEAMLERERGAGGTDDHVIDVDVHLKGGRVVGRAVGTTFENAADRVVEIVLRQVEKHRDKRVREPRRRIS